MTNNAAVIKALDQTTLTLLVRRAVGRDTVEVLDWEVHELGGRPTNPTSLGLYRVTGRGNDQGTTLPWSLVLKALQSPVNVGLPGLGEPPSHWNYWKRELLAYQSMLLDDLPGGLHVPRFFGAVDQPGDIVWLWLEDISAFDHSVWTHQTYQLAARHLGRFHGSYLRERALPTQSWLNKDFLKAWCRFVQEQIGGLLDRLAQPDDMFQTVHQLAPPAQIASFVSCLRNPEPFLSALNHLPQTLCHYDANPYNLLVRTTDGRQDQLIVIDWQSIGVGPIGEDISQFVTTIIAVHAVEDWQQLDTDLFTSYVNGLRDAQWEGNAWVARRGYAMSAVLRQGFFLLFLVHQQLGQTTGGEVERRAQPHVEAFLQKTARVFCHLFALAEEAHQLLLIPHSSTEVA